MLFGYYYLEKLVCLRWLNIIFEAIFFPSLLIHLIPISAAAEIYFFFVRFVLFLQ